MEFVSPPKPGENSRCALWLLSIMNTDIQEDQSKVLCIFRHTLFLLSAGFPPNARLLAQTKHVDVSLSFIAVHGNSLSKNFTEYFTVMLIMFL